MFAIHQNKSLLIKIKILFLLLCSVCFADNASVKENLSLIEQAEKQGITIYWDTLSSNGVLEKNGHQVTFTPDSQVIILDNDKIKLTDAPIIKNDKLLVSNDFVSELEKFFKEESSSVPYKVGVILLDPGHGGKDPGALYTYNINGKKVTIKEKDITLKISKILSSKLKQTYPDKRIIMTRDTDKFLSLEERTEIANSVKLQNNEAVVYVSVHVNASLDKKASGYEVWYLSPGYRRTVLDESSVQDDKSLFPILNSLMEEEYTTESVLIAKFIMDGLQEQIGKQSKARGIKAAEWFVVRNANMPSVLVEVGFLTNQAEAMNLNSDSYLQKTAMGIYNGISAFITHFERSRGFTSN